MNDASFYLPPGKGTGNGAVEGAGTGIGRLIGEVLGVGVMGTGTCVGVEGSPEPGEKGRGDVTCPGGWKRD